MKKALQLRGMFVILNAEKDFTNHSGEILRCTRNDTEIQVHRYSYGRLELLACNNKLHSYP